MKKNSEICPCPLSMFFDPNTAFGENTTRECFHFSYSGSIINHYGSKNVDVVERYNIPELVGVF